jgi:aspartyl-tRNA(Asn)/glutamyl-tRNA(Gln) amidotransferase subunit A
MKTTVGRVSNYGTLRLSDTLDTIGPITRDVEDAALLFSVLAGPDAYDPQTLRRTSVDVLTGLRKSPAGLRLAVLPAEQLGEVDAEVAQAFDAALVVLRDLGVRIDTLALPLGMPALADLTGRIIAAEGYALNRAWIDRDDLPFDTDVRSRLRAGKALSAADYLQAMAQRCELREQVGESLRDFDGLVLPTTPVPAMPLAAIDQSQAPMSRLTRPINLLDLCALSLPCGFTRAGLPVSLQIVGGTGEEARILRIGLAYENATRWHAHRPSGLD